jgi:hypothetical protein
MVHTRTRRRRCGLVGGGLVGLVAVVVAVGGAVATPTATAQVGLLGIAGTLDLVAATENPVTARIEWFRLSGVANVALGVAVPVGLLGIAGVTGTILFGLTGIGGLALAAIGADTAVYAGRHLYQRPLDEPRDRDCERTRVTWSAADRVKGS